MAEATFPVFSGANWWKLRNKFKTSYPKSSITDEYLASVLGMQIASVKNNGLLSNLRALGLLDEENKCTDLANRWRLDDTYIAACKEMRDRIYPSELIDIGTDRGAVTTWFMNKSGAGESLASKLTALYMLISVPEIKEPTVKSKPASKAATEKPLKTNVAPTPQRQKNTPPPVGGDVTIPIPSMNINLQIHISADASPAQIDQIFSSMAKHLYGRE